MNVCLVCSHYLQALWLKKPRQICVFFLQFFWYIFLDWAGRKGTKTKKKQDRCQVRRHCCLKESVGTIFKSFFARSFPFSCYFSLPSSSSSTPLRLPLHLPHQLPIQPCSADRQLRSLQVCFLFFVSIKILPNFLQELSIGGERKLLQGKKKILGQSHYKRELHK